METPIPDAAPSPSPAPLPALPEKPERLPFLLPYLLPSLIGVGLLAVPGVAIAATAQSLPIAAGVAAGAVVLLGLCYFLAAVVYDKERYEVLPSRLVCHTGTLFSGRTAELEVRNITHVHRRLPWIRYMLFDVGDISIQSAGSSDSQVVLRSVRRPKEVYAQVQELMQRNGFRLTQRELLHQEQPDFLGVVLECVSAVVWVAVTLLFLGAGAIAENPKLLLLGIPIFTLLGIGLLFHYLDMRRRTYRVFSDMVVYEEGFLTRDDAFIPGENIADSNTNRALLDRLLGLFDVQISCQGSSQQIAFRRLRRGVELSAAIDQVVARAPRRPASAAPAAAEERAARAPAPPPPTPTGEAWTGTLRPYLTRALAPAGLTALGLFPLVPVWLAYGFRTWAQAYFTRYEVRPRSVKSTYKFITSQEREFTYDKITGVVLRETPFDTFLGTLTIRLWSIGSNEPLDLLHIPHEEIDLVAFLHQCNVASNQELLRERSRFEPGRWVRRNLGGAFFVALLSVALSVGSAFLDPRFVLLGLAPLPLVAVAFAYLRAYYARMEVAFFDRHLEAREGLIIRTNTYARYDNIKKVRLRRYPWGDEGDVHFFVAGEHRLMSEEQQRRQSPLVAAAVPMVIPYGFDLLYADHISRKGELLDELIDFGPQPHEVTAYLEGAPAPPPPPLRVSAPALANRLLPLVLVSVLTVVGIPLLPLSLAFTILDVRRRSFVLERGRVARRWGIVYGHQESVLFTRIDSLRKDQGLLNKLFNNGSVTLFTAGSSQPDLILEDLPDAASFYEELKGYYGRGRHEAPA
ncbi:MAG: PH domain-containing protein [Planctomycetota bacterium]